MRTTTLTGHIRWGGAVALLALIGVSSIPAFAAEPATGFYIAGAAGVNIMQQESVNSVRGVTTGNLNINTDLGGVGVLSGGYGWGNGIRTEFQFNYRYNGLKSLEGPLGNTPGFRNGNSGSEQKYGPMPTLLYDFNDAFPNFVPYVGLGIGYQAVQEKLSINGTTSSKTKGGFATQAILGVAFPVDSMPGLSITADYRFLAVLGNRTYNNVEVGDSVNHAFLIGVRYAFGAAPAPQPPPAPVAMPAPAPARSYLVFFDWDKAVLTDRARQIVSEAASNATKVQLTRIDVNGYTDTSGKPRYNQGLSVRRAEVVAAELIKDGVPKNVIAIQGFGETHLLVPTGGNVREPQNRRVEIIIH